MIQILELHIEEFRGIRKLDLNLDGNHFAIHGPNGSGKSGVVDAIGFALTGTIARLTGAGTGAVSMQRHGPHVHKRDDPAAAKVTLKFKDTTTGKTGTITRAIKNAGNYILEPNTPQLRSVIESVAQHPELTLSRREIIKFILTEPGKRADEVQALLQLDALDSQRKALRSAVTRVAKEKSTANNALENAQSSFMRHFDIPEFVPAEILSQVNERRALLGLSPFTELSSGMNFKEGIDQNPQEVPFNKASASSDIDALRSWLSNPGPRDESLCKLQRILNELGDNVTVLDSLQHRSFVESGLELVADDGRCPLCDTAWDTPESLREHLAEKIHVSDVAKQLERNITDAAAQLIQHLRTGQAVTKSVRNLATTWGTPQMQTVFEAWHDDLKELENKLTTVSSILATRDQLNDNPLAVPANLMTELNQLAESLAARPDTSAKRAARDWLIIAAERWTQHRQANASCDKAVKAHKLAQTLYDTYCTIADEALTNLYNEVEKRFSHFYQRINADDESAFKAELEPSAGKLDLNVDFYGLGMFPPGAYHSEGHQDGMGVCLYLALVEKLMGKDFRFAVLDDVVMSVDSNHRKEFCKLLKTEFPGVQFIITTHDPVWAKQMQSSHLITKQSQIRFHGWNVDTGPSCERGIDFWDKIASDLANDDVEAAAHKLRRGLEAELPELAEELRARVAYKGDARYDLGEFQSAIKGRHGDWLKKAAAAADSWGNSDAQQKIKELRKAHSNAMLMQEKESWAVNALVHYNEWATMSKSDFRPVVEAWKQFLCLFRCGNEECGSWIGVSGTPGHEDSLRCRCGAYNFNLLAK